MYPGGMTQLGARLSLVAALLAAACGSPPLDGLDGGTGEMSDDAGAPVEPELDAGELDGGALDAGVADAEPPPPPPDAGPAPTPRDAGPAPDPRPTETVQTYKLLQWNIAGSAINDCRTPAITNAVLTYVRNRGVHFISLNEICRAQYDAIRNALRREWGKSSTAVFSAWEFSGHRVGNAIFSRYDIRVVTREAIGTDRYGTRTCSAAGCARSITCGSARLTSARTIRPREISSGSSENGSMRGGARVTR